MASKALTGALVAIALAATGALGSATPAVAKGGSFGFFFGSPGPYVHFHKPRAKVKCRTQYRVVWRHGKKQRVAVGQRCPRHVAKPHVFFHFRLH